MNLRAAQSLTAWLWSQQPALVYLLAKQLPKKLGCCFVGCGVSLFSCDTASSVGDFFGSGAGSCLASTGGSFDLSSLSCSGLDSLNLGCDAGLTCIPTLGEADLTPVDTSAVTGGCSPIGCGGITGSCNAISTGLSGIASFLASSQGLTALANVASSYFNAQAAGSAASAAAARAQAAIVAAQAARAAVGRGALPVTYVANGATGATVPMLSTTGGLLPLTGSTLGALTPASIEVFLAQYGTWLLIGGAAAFLLAAASRKRSST